MQYTANEAAKATGKNVATITRAIKSGKISAYKDDNGAWRIDPVELHRSFPAFAQTLQNTKMQRDANPPQKLNTSIDNTLQEELSTLRERVRSQDQLLDDRAEQIADLRIRLDREGEERRKLAAVLTDQRGSGLISYPPKASKSSELPAPEHQTWWRRWRSR